MELALGRYKSIQFSSWDSKIGVSRLLLIELRSHPLLHVQYDMTVYLKYPMTTLRIICIQQLHNYSNFSTEQKVIGGLSQPLPVNYSNFELLFIYNDTHTHMGTHIQKNNLYLHSNITWNGVLYQLINIMNNQHEWLMLKVKLRDDMTLSSVVVTAVRYRYVTRWCCGRSSCHDSVFKYIFHVRDKYFDDKYIVQIVCLWYWSKKRFRIWFSMISA